MIAKVFEIRETGDRGKGLFAREFVPVGTIICFECNACRTLADIQPGTMSVQEKEALFLYAYRKQNGQYVAPCDETRYLNHSCDANILGVDLGFDIVVRDIQVGDEATYDYRAFYEDLRMTCRCGAPNCCGVLDFRHPVPEDLARFWKTRIDAALDRVNHVPQPLQEALKQKSIFLPLHQ